MAPRITCHCGECQKCKHREYMRAWYARPENTERHRETARQSRQRRLEYVQAYDRERGRRPGHPLKERARNLIRSAIFEGRLERLPCQVCGNPNTDAHHEDYSKPFDVEWLCERHHGQRHQFVNPEVEEAA